MSLCVLIWWQYSLPHWDIFDIYGNVRIVNSQSDDVHGFEALGDIVKDKVAVLHQFKMGCLILTKKNKSVQSLRQYS